MKEEDMNFEDAMKALEQIANELENGELSLEQSVDKFEEGIKISKKCNEILEKAEKEISILIKDGDEIKPISGYYQCSCDQNCGTLQS